jgi:hypothetical protein
VFLSVIQRYETYIVIPNKIIANKLGYMKTIPYLCIVPLGKGSATETRAKE